MIDIDMPASEKFVYLEMFDAILSRRLTPGIKLKEDTLANIFSVNRNIIRRTLLRLSHDGIVEIRQNKGANVIQPSVKQAKEIFEARRLIEGRIIIQATGQADRSQFKALRQLIDQEKEQAKQNSRSKMIRMSGDFHLKLAEISNNSILASFLFKLVPQTSLIISQYEKSTHSLCCYQEHQALLDLMENGRAEEAAKLMDRHLEKIEYNLFIQEQEEPFNLAQAFSHLQPKTGN